MQHALDLPAPNEVSDALSLRLQGWVHEDTPGDPLVGVEARADGVPIGNTRLLYVREDVSAALGISGQARTGFTLLAAAPAAVHQATLKLTLSAVRASGRSEVFAERELRLSGKDYRSGDWGVFVKPDFNFLVKREHMYHSGPSQGDGSPETLAFLKRFLPPPPASVLDIGCGLGFYGRHLLALGYAWTGAEVKPEDCAKLQEMGLPHRQISTSGLPFADASFDTAMAVEVLEHTDDPLAFIAEARRVVKDRFIVSVPNMEVVTYWRAHYAVPWHLLESDHKSFFSRASLRDLLARHFSSVEIISYGEAPLPSAEGARLGYHLLAVARV